MMNSRPSIFSFMRRVRLRCVCIALPEATAKTLGDRVRSVGFHSGTLHLFGDINRAVAATSGVVARMLIVVSMLLAAHSNAKADPGSANLLRRYVAATDSSFGWKRLGERDGFVELEVTSQTWPESPWRHLLLIFGQAEMVPNAPAFLFLTGGSAKTEDLEAIRSVAERARVPVALLTKVPNQPLFDGRKEDGLLAYSFDQFARTGDPDWPVIFPMVKSVVRAMDAVNEFTNGAVNRFVISGASKRGWISYLTAGVDSRVVGIAPRVFEMINMREQARWQRAVYGAQSEKLKDFTALGLIDRLFSEPKLAELARAIDPYEYRQDIQVPKLVLLGTNDPYWVVDAQRWYWADLKGPKWLVQYPNLGHNLGPSALDSIGSWAEYLGLHREFPTLSWSLGKEREGKRYLVRASEPPIAASLWRGCASTRDLRAAEWRSEAASVSSSGVVSVRLPEPKDGFCAYLVEANFVAPSGRVFPLSTEAVVLPE